MTFILRLAKVGLRFLYLFLRPLPLKNKVVFFSRQSSTIPLDFTLLAGDGNPVFLPENAAKDQRFQLLSLHPT